MTEELSRKLEDIIGQLSELSRTISTCEALINHAMTKSSALGEHELRDTLWRLTCVCRVFENSKMHEWCVHESEKLRQTVGKCTRYKDIFTELLRQPHDYAGPSRELTTAYHRDVTIIREKLVGFEGQRVSETRIRRMEEMNAAKQVVGGLLHSFRDLFGQDQDSVSLSQPCHTLATYRPLLTCLRSRSKQRWILGARGSARKPVLVLIISSTGSAIVPETGHLPCMKNLFSAAKRSTINGTRVDSLLGTWQA